ncbi:MAG: hypothetical protein KatS3mg104_2789 [Phycisphaerae bacterium]|jgi:hypothetical protein|nr:MAG: hypothetical protein KatS3mg104_2789 [Phycisphaerae bacterium]
MVGLLPLIAVTVIEQETLDLLPGFKKRFEWFLSNRQDLAHQISWTRVDCRPWQNRWLLAIPSKKRLICALRYVLDEAEFLSPYGIRSLSKFHQEHPYVFHGAGRSSVWITSRERERAICLAATRTGVARSGFQ